MATDPEELTFESLAADERDRGGPAWRAAVDAGIDVTLLERNRRLSPSQLQEMLRIYFSSRRSAADLSTVGGMVSELDKQPIHLGRGGTAVVQPEHTGDMAWYAGYGARHGDDGADGRLVAMHTFTEPWTSWEVHPKGSEVVLCTAGEITLVQEIDGKHERTTLRPGQYAINEPGVWHTADVEGTATAVFITSGEGTDHRPR